MTTMPNQTFVALGFARANPSLGGEKIASVLDRTLPPKTTEKQKATLPLLATANDIRDLIRYLKKHPEGVTIVEALSEVKKRILDPRKISAYETWGVVSRQGDWLKLSELGWEFSRRLTSEAALFRTILERVEHYRSVLEVIHSQQLKLVTHEDIARFWRSRFSEDVDLHQSKTVESNVVSFLHLCQAAELGSLTVGKRGQPARMRVDLEEVDDFINGQWNLMGAEADSRPMLRPIRPTPSNLLPWEAGRLRICLSGCPTSQNVMQVQSLLDLMGIDSEILERQGATTLTSSESAFEAMRRCEAGLFVVTTNDCWTDEAGNLNLKFEVQAEISAAYLFYNRRIVLLWDERIALPTAWQQLTRCTFANEEFTWETGLQLTKALLAFRR